jgi:hypothetical protein
MTPDAQRSAEGVVAGPASVSTTVIHLLLFGQSASCVTAKGMLKEGYVNVN